MGWVTDVHPTEGELAACVQCGLCLPHCPTYRLTGRDTDSPRGRLMAMSAVADGLLEVDDSFADITGFCLQCRACEAVCPSLVPFGRAMEGARAEVAAQVSDRSGPLRRFVLGRVLGWRAVMSLATLGLRVLRAPVFRRLVPSRVAASMSGVRPLGEVRSPARVVGGTGHRGVAVVLRGCVMEQWFAPVQQAAAELLVAAGYEVVETDGQTCCGALAAHDGAVAGARRLARTNVAALSNVDLVVVTAAGCSAHMSEYGHWADGGAELASRTKDVTMVVAELIASGSLPTLARGRGPVAVQDPCHLRHAQRETAAPRTVVSAAGYTPVEVDPAGMCCGAAGIYSLRHPEASAELGRRKAAEVGATGSTLVASANPGCEMQLRQYLDDWYHVSHPIELYNEARKAQSP